MALDEVKGCRREEDTLSLAGTNARREGFLESPPCPAVAACWPGIAIRPACIRDDKKSGTAVLLGGLYAALTGGLYAALTGGL